MQTSETSDTFHAISDIPLSRVSAAERDQLLHAILYHDPDTDRKIGLIQPKDAPLIMMAKEGVNPKKLALYCTTIPRNIARGRKASES